MKRNTSHSALQLWLTLASIPVLAVIAVYIYGALAFDDNKILEIDNSMMQEPEKIEGDDRVSDLDREFTAPLDKPMSNSMTSQRSSSVLADISSKGGSHKEQSQSLTQMLSKKNENLKMGSNGHPILVRVQEEDNLSRIADRYLGNYKFWPYVYMVNKEKLSSPNAVRPGMTLNLPDSVFYDLNLQDTLAIQKAEALGRSILGEE